MDFDFNAQNINIKDNLICFGKLKQLDNFQGPYNLTPGGDYPEGKMIYKYAYPNSTYPIVEVPYVISDKYGDSLAPGFYEVALSDDEKFLMLLQSKRIMAKIPVVKILHNDDDFKEANNKIKIIEDKMAKLNENIDKRKYKKLTKEKEELEKGIEILINAELYESKDGYFILKYERNFVKAYGYIPI